MGKGGVHARLALLEGFGGKGGVHTRLALLEGLEVRGEYMHA